jgi:multiple sugar transport system substrate-binding protein
LHARHLPAALALAASLALGACGFSGEEAGSGPRAINWYAFNEPGGSYQMAVDDCNKQADGRYTINYVKLPNIADQQRELLVRRLAAEDDDIDEGPLETVRYQDQIWAIPFTSNTQLLWYRKDRVDAPPDDFTWDEMIDQAVENGTSVEVQAAQYEGLTVWINALIAGAGGQLVNEDGETQVDDSAARAAEIESKLANSAAAPPGMSTNREDQGRIGFEEGRSDYQLNYTFIYPSAEAIEGFQDKIGWARFPRTVKDQPSRPPLGGFNLAVSEYSNNPDLAFEAAECLANEDHQALAAELGGLPPTTESVYEDEKVTKAFPFADLLRESIDEAAARPTTPAYSDISLALQKTFHPPEGIEPDGIVEKLRDRMEKAGQGEIF